MATVKYYQSNFTNGEISPYMEGRVDFNKYYNSASCLENFLVYPHGPATKRPGFRFIGETKEMEKYSRLIPFIFAETDALVLEFGDKYVRFYKNRELITKSYSSWQTATPYVMGDLVIHEDAYYRCLATHVSGTFSTDYSNGFWRQTSASDTAYELVTPYDHNDVAKIQYCQSCDVLYLFHSDYAPVKLMRADDDDWSIQTINFRPPALTTAVHYPDATITLSNTTGDDVTVTADDGVFVSGDIGRSIISGVGRAIIKAFTSSTLVTVDVIDDFASTAPIESGNWRLTGPMTACLKPSDSPTVGSRCTLTVVADDEDDPLICLSPTPTQSYWQNTSGDYYYLKYDSPYYPADKPAAVYVNGVNNEYTGSGQMSPGQWAWTIPYFEAPKNSIVVRVNSTTNPNSCSGVWMSTSTVLRDVFRDEDVGRYIRIFGGILKIVSVSDEQTVVCEVMKEMDYESVFYDEDGDGEDEIQSTYDWTLYESMWSDDAGYPSTGVFYEDRLAVAGVPGHPETIALSMTGDYENFSLGTEDDDACSFTLNGRTVNYVRWLDSRDYLLAGTMGAEWRIGPEDRTKPLTATNVVAKQQTTYGCANIMPLSIGHCTLFVQRSQTRLREFTLDRQSINDDFVAPDLSILSEHITADKISGTCYQQEPLSVVWVYLVDGSLASMTYMRTEEVVGWARHPLTNGFVESMASIPGDGYDEVYAIVRREINGTTARYVEVLENLCTDDDDTYSENYGLNAFFVDSGVTYNGWNTDDTLSMTLSAEDYTAGNTLTLTASGSGHEPFTAESVGQSYRLRSGDDVIDVIITEYTSSTEVSCISTIDVPDALQETGTYDFATLVTTVTGLEHLEGETVSILADGSVETSQEVTDGSVTIGAPASIVHVGLGYDAKLTTCRPEIKLRDGISQGRNARVVNMIVRCMNSGTFKAGQDDTQYDEYGFKVYDPELYQTVFATSDTPLGSPSVLYTGDAVCPIDDHFDREPRVTVVQDKPLPLTIVAVVSEIEVSA